MKTLLISFLLLTGCATKATRVELDIPARAPLEKVIVKEVSPDGICPGDSQVYMSKEMLQALLRNVINTETYIKQLENLIHSLTKKDS